VNKTILVFKGINFSYPSQEQDALRNLTLEIPQGSIVAILGPNGAGKTTLLHLVLGWLKPRNGQVLLADQPMEAYTRREIGQWIGLVPQSEHIPFDYSVLNYVLFGRTPYLKPLEMPGEEDLHIAHQALARMELEHLAYRSVAKLSGGERQMVLIARALAQLPRLLLLDEPTSHLDLGNKGRLTSLLRQLSGDGVTIIFTTHEPDIAAAVADRIVLMRNGQILTAGELANVFNGQYLSECYQTPVEVVEVGSHRVVLWN